MALDLTYDPNWKPDSKSGDVDLTYDPNWKPQGILGGLGSSLKRGIDSTVDYGKISLTDNPDEIAGIVSENIRNRPQPSAAQQKMNAEIAPYAKEASDAQGIVGNIGAYAKLYGKRAMQLAENPREFAGMVAENLPNSAPGIAGMVAGGAAGAATPVPFGAAIGGVVGGTAGGYKIEQGSSMFDQVVKEAQARGIDTNNKPAMSAMIAEKYPEFLKASQLKGVGTAGTDAVLNVATLGVAGIGERALAREARSVADLAKAGTMTGEEAASAIAGIEAKNAARNTIGQKALRGAGVAAGEMAGESLSEAAGQQLAYGKLDPLDVVDEGLLAFGQGVGMAAGRKFISPLVGATDKDSVTQEIERARAFATALNQSVGGDVNAVPTLITDLGPLQQRIDDLQGIGNARMNDAERAKYEQEFNAAFGEVVGYTTDKDGMEIPFTMGDYLNSQVRSADITRDRPKAANAAQQSESRLQQVADEETTGYVAPEIPVVGTLSAVANMAIKSGANAQNQMQQAMQAALAKQGKPEKANGPIAAATDAQVATQGAQGAGGNVPGSAGVPSPSPAGNQERSGNGAEVAAPGLRPAVSAGIAGGQAANAVSNSATVPALNAQNSVNSPATTEQSSGVRPASADTALQNRDRGRAASVNQMQSIARNPDYMRLGPSRTPDSGAPMVFAVGGNTNKIQPSSFGANDIAVMSDGQRVPFRYAVVDARSVEPSNFADGATNPAFDSEAPGTLKALNNGRTAGVRAAHEAGSSANYTAELLADQAHGVSPAAIRSTPNPMLVRVYAEQANTGDMAAKSQGQGLGMSASERAAQDAEQMTGDVLDKFAPGDIASAGNRDFVRAFVGKLAENELADMMDATGNLSQDGRRRIEAALLTAAYGKSDLVQELFESTDTDIKAIGNALKVMSGQWAAMRQAAKEGSIDPATDMTANLIEAVNLVRRSRAEGSSIAELAGQGDLMGGNYLSELSEGFLRIFYKGKNYDRARGGDKVIAALQEVVTSAMNTKAEAGLFGDSFKATPKQIVESARSKIDDENKPASQAALFGANGQAAASSQGNNGEGAQKPSEVGQRSVGTGRSEETGKQAEPLKGDNEAAKDAAPPDTESAEEKIRAAFDALPSVSLGTSYPITVEHNGVSKQMMARQDRLANGASMGRGGKPALHITEVARGKMIAGDATGWLLHNYRLSGKNKLEFEGLPQKISDEEAKKFQANFGTGKQAEPVALARGEVGASLTKAQRKSVLKTLVDVYRQKNAPREMKGVDTNGNERYGYVHSPDLFEKSDITGAMVRYYVTLPDGRIAHPTELFADYTQSDIDAAMQKEIDADRDLERNDKSERERLLGLAAPTVNEANGKFNHAQRFAPDRDSIVPALLTNGELYLRSRPENADKAASLLGDGWRVEELSKPELKKGDRFKDAQGKTWEVWTARTSLVEAFPVIDGKIKVSRDDSVRFATDDKARRANPEARSDVFPLPKEKTPVTPQLLVGDPERYIKVAADSIQELRRVDVYRVLIESNRSEFRLALADYIKGKRPDLAGEVDAVLADAALEAKPTPTVAAEKPAESKSQNGTSGAEKNGRDSFTLERLNRETNSMEPVTFERGEYVRYSLGAKDVFGEIDGISHAKREFSVDGLWYPFGFAYKADRPVEAARTDTVPLSSVIEKANAKFGEGLTEADRVPRQYRTLADIDSAIEGIFDGTVSLADYKAAFNGLMANKEAIVTELGKMTIPQLHERFGKHPYGRQEKKGDIVERAFEIIRNAFALRRSFGPNSYTFSNGGLARFEADKLAALTDMVNASTAEDLKAFADEIGKTRAARQEKIEAAQDPKTIEDFDNALRLKKSEGMTFAEARMSLTTEQRAEYDRLKGIESRNQRKARADQQKTDVRVASQTTEGQVIETKHTKTGDPLFVVKAAERVERDVYAVWNATAKRMGGYYSAFRGNGAVPGFQFKTRENADAFLAFIGGNAEAAKEAVQERRDAFADDRSQSAVERLNEMAERLEEKADESLGRERKANTERRARFAASAEAAANAEKAMAKTMRRIAEAISNGTAQFLDRVRQKAQIEYLASVLRTAKDSELRTKYPSYADQEKHKGEPATGETADYAEFPQYAMMRSDLANLARKMISLPNMKMLGQRILKVADDTSAAYTAFAKEHLLEVSRFGKADGSGWATFSTLKDAERSIELSNLAAVAVPLQIKRGEYRIVLSPSEAINRGIWKGDDRKIYLSADIGEEIVEKLGKLNRKYGKRRGMDAPPEAPWQFENAYNNRKRLAGMGIEQPWEFRAALREFASLKEAPKEADKIKAMERAMIGRKNDGLDFFPTPAGTAQEMVDAAEIAEGMDVLEPSAGMGHIAEQIREVAGVEPDVIEFNSDRRELLEAKGFNVIGSDFLEADGRYDRIIMNPPFSNRRDADHVRHAYSLLKPGGRLVAIMGEGVFFGQDKKAVSFREWLDDVGGTSEKLEEGTFLDPSLPVNTATNSRMVVIDKTAGEVAHADNEGAGNVAAQSTISPADKAIYGMATEGKSAAEILKFIASASRSPFYRQLAKLLLKTGIAPQVMASTTEGWRFNAGNDKKYAAAYNESTNTIALFRPAAAERNFLHEAMHAATIRALGRKGLASGQMKALFEHVKKNGNLKGMYGMSDVDEFIAEAFSNPKFQAALKKIAAPKASGSTLSSAWHWFVRIVKGILGLPSNQESALSQALEIGLGVMRENMRLNGDQKNGNVRGMADKDTVAGTQAPTSAGDGSKAGADVVAEQTTDWAKVGKVFVGDGGRVTVYFMKGFQPGKNEKRYVENSVMDAFRPILPDGQYWRFTNNKNELNHIKSGELLRSKNHADNSDEIGLSVAEGAHYGIQGYKFGYIVSGDVIGRGSDGEPLLDVGKLRPVTKLMPVDEIVSKDRAERAALMKARGWTHEQIADIANGTFKIVTKPNEPSASAGSDAGIRYNVADEGWSVTEPSKMDDVIYALQDKQIDMKRVMQSIMKTGKQIKDSVNPYLQEELFHGRAAKGVKDFLDFELRPLLAEMNKAGVDMGDFEEYLWNRHAEERNKQIAKINPDMPDGGSGIETAKARAYLAGLSAEQRKTFEMLAAKVEAMNRQSQRVLVESGLEKQSTIDAWNGAYQHYVPLQRDDVDSGHVGTGKGFSVRGSSSKRAMGSGKKVVDIIANLTMQRERNIVRAEKNRVSNALLGLAVQNPNPDFWKVDQAPKERVVQEKAIYTVLDSDGNKIEEFTRMDEAERLANKTPGAIIDQAWGDRVTERVMPGFTSRDNVLLTRINGEDHYVIFNERDERAMRMATAMKNLDMDNLGRVLSVVGKATRYLASINTQYNPVFGVINLIRDAQGALINLSSTPLAGEQKRVLGYTKDALVGIYKDIRAHRAGGKPSSNWAALFEEFQKEGGQTGYRDQYANAEARAESIKSELEQFKDGKAKQLARGLFGWLSDYNETMENAVRLAAYKAAKEKGMSNQQAASLAKNITVNFNRKGQMATQVGALYAFFNASVQGTARIAETLFDQHGGDIKNVRLSKKGKQILAGGIMLGAMQALLLAAAGFDDDEPPEFIRERNLILPIGGGKYLTLAMPLGLHVIPGIGRIATEFVLSGGKDPLKRIAAFGSMFADAFNPIGSAGWSLQTITPSVVDPFAALAENKDFTGKEIYREDFNKLNPTPGHARAKDVATFYSRAISEALNFITGGSEFKPGLVSWSPDSIDYLIGQVTGGVGREANKALQTAGSAYSGEDLPLYKIPLVGRFVGDTAGQSGQSQKFYDAIKQINMHEAQYKGLIKDGRSAEAREYLAENPAVRLIMAGNHAELAVRKLRTMKRDLVENDADQDKIRAIDARITETMRRFNERAGAFI